jgi:hypothetical protein
MTESTMAWQAPFSMNEQELAMPLYFSAADLK